MAFVKYFLINSFFLGSFVFAGEIVIFAAGDTFPNNLAKKSIKKPFHNFREIAVLGSMFSVNLEGAFCKDINQSKKCAGNDCHSLITDHKKTVEFLKDIGVNHVGIANNHINDCGQSGQEFTKNTLQNAGFYVSGTKSQPYAIVNNSGKKIAILSMSPNSFAANFNQLNTYESIINELATMRKNRDIALWVVNLHMGSEDYPESLKITKEEEVYIGEKRGNPYKLARYFIDSGADVIIGHGPHVPRGFDLYKNKFIAYSLGNFFTDNGIGVADERGTAPLLKVSVDDSGDFKNALIIPFEQRTQHRPIFDSKHRACKIMQNATSEISDDLIFADCLVMKKRVF